jgi:tetratricopeptide (TPR) repeat protein
MDKRKKQARKEQRRRESQRQARSARPSLDPAELERVLARSHAAIEAGQPEKAEVLLRKALRASPDHAQLLGNLVAALEPQDRLVEAVAVAERCAATHPELAAAHYTLGVVLQFSGDLARATACFRRTVELEPKNAAAWCDLALAKRFDDRADPDLAALRALVGKLPAGGEQRIALHFALGKALEDLGDFDASFEHYARGNRQMRARISYRREELQRLVDGTLAAQGPEYLHAGVSTLASDAAPILIVGMPRSGSSLVEQILASHPRVAGVGEVPDLAVTINTHVANPAARGETVAGWSAEEHARLGRAYVERLRRRAPDAQRVVDKFLINHLHVGFVHRALPNARVVHCVREAADNCFSCFKVRFASPVHFTYDLDELGHTYREVMRLMEHWHRHLPGRILDVRYEDLVADQEAETRRLLAFCGLEWDAACLRFHETRRRVSSASATQVRKPLYESSLGQWRNYERHLAPLLAALGPHAPPRAGHQP